MAVTTSNGNGFALYNGVKLPDINEVWTDKVTYPYAFISGGADFGYMLTCTKVQPIHYGDGDVEIRSTATTVYLGTLLPGETEWAVFGEDNFNGNGSYVVASSGMPIVWTNTDILNTDNTVYLAASDPIPLDGMNVIEWDGDTTGLSVIPSDNGTAYYRVADYVLSSSAVIVFDDPTDSFGAFVYDIFESADGAWTVRAPDGITPFVVAFPNEIASQMSVDSGIYAWVWGDGYVPVIAYTASGGGEGGGESTAQKHYCRVNGSVHEVEGGTARVSGSYHEIEGGTVRIEGAYYEIPFSGGCEGGGGGGSFDGWLLKNGEALVEFTKVALNASNNPELDKSTVLWQDGYVQLKPGSFTATVPNPAGGTMETQVPILPFLVSAYEIDMSQWSTLHFVYRGYAQFGYGSLTGTLNTPIAWMQSNYNNNSSSYVEETIDLDSGANGHIAIGMYNTAANSTLYITDIWLT